MRRTKNRWLIAASAVGIHLSIGSVYAWSVFSRNVLNMQLAVEEAVLNVCQYAYLEEASINSISYASHDPRRLSIRVSDDPAFFKVEVEDRGFPFNPLSVQAPDVEASLEGRQPEGLGILLMQKMVDEVSYPRIADKNVLTLIMHKAPASVRERKQGLPPS